MKQDRKADQKKTIVAVSQQGLLVRSGTIEKKDSDNIAVSAPSTFQTEISKTDFIIPKADGDLFSPGETTIVLSQHPSVAHPPPNNAMVGTGHASFPVSIVTSSLMAMMGSRARRSHNSREFLQQATRVLCESFDADAAAFYYADRSRITIERKSRPETLTTHVALVLGAAHCAPGKSRQFPLQVPHPSDSNPDPAVIIEAIVRDPGPGSVVVGQARSTGSTSGGYGGSLLLLNPTAAVDRQYIQEVVDTTMHELMMMIDIISDREVKDDVCKLNDASLASHTFRTMAFVGRMVSFARERLSCDGVSFFIRDFSREEAVARLVGSAPRSPPALPVEYSVGEHTITGIVLSREAACTVDYVLASRSALEGFLPPKWRDTDATDEVACLMFAPVFRERELSGLLRCSLTTETTKVRAFTPIDRRRAQEVAELLTSWYLSARKEMQLAASYLDIAHDVKQAVWGIRNNVTTVSRLATFSRTLKVEEELALSLDHIRENAELIGSLLSTLHPRQQKPRVEEVLHPFRPYADLCRPIEEDLRRQADAKGLMFEYFGGDQLGLIWASIQDFRQIVMNILGNAVKYTYPREKILIRMQRATQSNPYAVIRFASHSLEITQDEREAIFMPSQRSAAADASAEVGDGRGLTIARALARKYGGDIVLTTHDGLNIFSLLIPRELFTPRDR